MERTIDLYLLSQYFKSECTIEEESIIKQWAEQSKSNNQILVEAKRIWDNDKKIKHLNTWLPYIIERLKLLN